MQRAVIRFELYVNNFYSSSRQIMKKIYIKNKNLKNVCVPTEDLYFTKVGRLNKKNVKR